jgi:hypothetical protein
MGRDRKDRRALDLARDYDSSAASKLVRLLLNFGLDGKGPLGSAADLGRKVQNRSADDDQAIDRLSRQALLGGAVGGFATGLGGFITMPVAIPVNIVEFYVQATRLVGAVATIRGYDTADPQIRTAVLLTLAGTKTATKTLTDIGISSPTGRIADIALRRLPPEALMVVNKAIGLQLLKTLGQRTLTRFGRALPLAGGVIGAGFDTWTMRRIARHAAREFPPIAGERS